MLEASATKTSVGGIGFTPLTATGAAQQICDMALARRASGIHVHLANAYSIALADEFEELKNVFNDDAALCFSDGKPVTWVSRLARGRRLDQVRGPQFFLDVFDRSQGTGAKHYLLGGRPEVLETLEAELRKRFPEASIVGVESPPFRALSETEQSAQIERIRQSGADLIWIGLGTPKQDYEAARIAAGTGKVTLAVGAAFDFAAGSVAEAPRWVRAAGLEWAFRFATEPRRLWRRYTFGNLRFAKSAMNGLRTERRAVERSSGAV